MTPSPYAAILILICQRPQATAGAIGNAYRMSPSEVRTRPVTLETMRLVAGRQDLDSSAPRRVFHVTHEDRRKAGISDVRGDLSTAGEH